MDAGSDKTAALTVRAAPHPQKKVSLFAIRGVFRSHEAPICAMARQRAAWRAGSAPRARGGDAAEAAAIRRAREGDAAQAAGGRAAPRLCRDLWGVRDRGGGGAGGALLAMRHPL